MPARQSLELIWRHRGSLVACVVACAAVGALLALATDPTYESRTQFLVSTATTGEDVGTAYQAELFSQQRVTTYAEIVSSPQLLERVARAMGRPGGGRELAGRVEASVIPETALIDVTASAGSAAESKSIADAVDTVLPGFVEELERPRPGAASPVRLAVTREGELPASAASPSLRLYLALGLLAGLALGAAGLALAAALDDRSGSIEALERLAGAPVVGTVTEDDDGGRPVLLEDPLSPRAEDYRRLRAQLEARWGDGALSSLSVTGLGTAPVAANLAIALAQTGRRVALLDGNPDDPRLSELFDLPAGPGLADVLAGDAPVDAALVPIDALSLAVVGAGTARHAGSEALASRRLPAVVAALREHADVVIVDAAALPAAAAAASAVLVVAGLDTPAPYLEATTRALRPSGAELGVVVNRRAGRRSRSAGASSAPIASAPPPSAGPAADGATHAAGRT